MASVAFWPTFSFRSSVTCHSNCSLFRSCFPLLASCRTARSYLLISQLEGSFPLSSLLGSHIRLIRPTTYLADCMLVHTSNRSFLPVEGSPPDGLPNRLPNGMRNGLLVGLLVKSLDGSPDALIVSLLVPSTRRLARSLRSSAACPPSRSLLPLTSYFTDRLLVGSLVGALVGSLHHRRPDTSPVGSPDGLLTGVIVPSVRRPLARRLTQWISRRQCA